MAFGASFGSFTTSCLDDIPFKIGPKFKPPTKVLLPPQLALSTPSSSRALNAEYSFEVEMAVLKWSEERERQLAEQRHLQEQIRHNQQVALSEQQQQQQNDDTDVHAVSAPEPVVTNTEPLYENREMMYDNEALYENTSSITYPKPAPRISKQKPNVPPRPVYANMALPNPVVANISDNILTPTPISQSESNEQVKTEPDNQVNTFDVTLFEQEDDPFDNLELQTINVLEELKNVLEETSKSSASPIQPSSDEADDAQIYMNTAVTSGTGLVGDAGNRISPEINGHSPVQDHIYENVDDVSCELPNTVVRSNVSSSLDLSNLPPVPPRRDLVGRSLPLPPIGTTSADLGLTAVTDNTQNCVTQSVCNENSETPVSLSTNHVNNIFLDSNNKPFPTYSAAPVTKPPRTFKYTRHKLDDMDNDPSHTEDSKSVTIQKATDTKSGVNFSVGFQNSRSSGDVNVRRAAVRKAPPIPAPPIPAAPIPAPRRSQSPPSRPSSNQSWNRYSPLPPPPSLPAGLRSNSGTNSQQISPVASANNTTETDRCSPSDPYFSLSTEAQGSVNNLVGMGFARSRVARAVERLGTDEKEVVEYLFLVDQLIEKGYSAESAEMALLIFRNSPRKAAAYLDLFTQFLELGFSGEKIKEALVDTNNDREKSLDILTAT